MDSNLRNLKALLQDLIGAGRRAVAARALAAFVPGQGIGGVRSYVRVLRQGRHNA